MSATTPSDQRGGLPSRRAHRGALPHVSPCSCWPAAPGPARSPGCCSDARRPPESPAPAAPAPTNPRLPVAGETTWTTAEGQQVTVSDRRPRRPSRTGSDRARLVGHPPDGTGPADRRRGATRASTSDWTALGRRGQHRAGRPADEAGLPPAQSPRAATRPTGACAPRSGRPRPACTSVRPGCCRWPSRPCRRRCGSSTSSRRPCRRSATCPSPRRGSPRRPHPTDLARPAGARRRR